MHARPRNTVILYFPDTGGQNFTPPFEMLFQQQALKDLPINVVLVDHRTGDLSVAAEKYGDSLAALVISTIIKYTSISISNQYKDGIEASAMIGARYDIPVIWTGLLPTIAAENLLSKAHINHVLKGQSEKILCKLLETLIKKEKPCTLENTRQIADSKYISDDTPAAYNSFEAYGHIDLSLLDTKAYIHKNTFDYVASIGCVNACGFCFVPLVYGSKWHHNSTENVVTHLTFVLTQHKEIRSVHFRDDNFMVNKAFVFDVLENLYHKDFRFFWSAQTSVNILSKYSDEDLVRLKDLGCSNISVGIESGDTFVLKNIAPAKKNKSKGVSAIKRLIKAGIMPSVTSIVGFPYNKVRDIKSTLRLLMRYKRLYPKLSLYCTVFQPLPETKVFKQLFPKHPPQNDLKDFNTWTTTKHRVLLKKFEQVYFPFYDKDFYKTLSPEIAKKIKPLNIILYPFIRLRFYFATTSFLWEYALAAPFLKKLQKQGLWSDKNELKGIRHHNTNYDYGYEPNK